MSAPTVIAADVSVWGPALITALAAAGLAWKGLRSSRREDTSAVVGQYSSLVHDMQVVQEELQASLARHRKSAERLRELNAELIAAGERDREERARLLAQIAECHRQMDEHAETCADLRAQLRAMKR